MRANWTPGRVGLEEKEEEVAPGQEGALLVVRCPGLVLGLVRGLEEARYLGDLRRLEDWEPLAYLAG
jgi:hypothetical protein